MRLVEPAGEFASVHSCLKSLLRPAIFRFIGDFQFSGTHALFPGVMQNNFTLLFQISHVGVLPLNEIISSTCMRHFQSCLLVSSLALIIFLTTSSLHTSPLHRSSHGRRSLNHLIARISFYKTTDLLSSCSDPLHT